MCWPFRPSAASCHPQTHPVTLQQLDRPSPSPRARRYDKTQARPTLVPCKMIPCPSNSASLSLVHRVPVTRADLKSMWPYGARLPRASPAWTLCIPGQDGARSPADLYSGNFSLFPCFIHVSLFTSHSQTKGTVRVYARVCPACSNPSSLGLHVSPQL